MPALPFVFTSSDDFAPVLDGQPIILRSSDPADITQSFTLLGTIAGVPNSETIAIDGMIEVPSLGNIDAITYAGLSAITAGTVSAHRQGVAGTGTLVVRAVPASGDTLIVGLTGETVTYTFRPPLTVTLTFPALAGNIAQGQHLTLTVGATTERYWADIDAAGTGAPAAPPTPVAIALTTGDTADDVAAAFVLALNANSVIFIAATTGVSGEVLLVRTAYDAVAAPIFAETFTGAVTYALTWPGPTGVGYEIRTLYSYVGASLATVGDIRDWIVGAIDDSGGGGPVYSPPLIAHPHLDAASNGNQTLTFVDRLACARALGWTTTASGTWCDLVTVSGGIDGPLILELLAGETSIYNSFELGSTDLSVANLPPGFTGTSDWLPVGGGQVMLELSCANITTAIDLRYETSTFGTDASAIARIGSAAIAGLDNRPLTAPDITNCTENAIEAMRMVIVANPNTTAFGVRIVAVFR